MESQTNTIKSVVYSGSAVNASTASTISSASVPVFSFFDLATNEIYWCDNGSGTIKKAPATGGTATTVVTLSPVVSGVYLRGLYIDETNHLAYWSETGAGTTDKVRRIDISGALPKASSAATDIVTGIDVVRGIAVDTGSANIYFADAGVTGQGKGIYRVTYAGLAIPASAATLISATPVSGAVAPQPNQLFLDRVNKFLYWADYAAGTANIKRVSVATGTVYPAASTAVYSGASVRGIYVNALENSIYWVEPKSLLVKKASLSTIPLATASTAVTNLTGFPRNLVYVSAEIVLPVTFLSAQAYPSGKDIRVDWTVAAEINMENYAVEKSADGVSFRDIGIVQATNSSSGNHPYTLTDYSPFNGDNFYRIRGVSLNGRTEFTQIMKVNIGSAAAPDIAVYPNPVHAKDGINLQLQNLGAGSCAITLFDKAGRLIFKENFVHNGGTSIEVINTTNLAAGIYSLRVVTAARSFSKEIMIR